MVIARASILVASAFFCFDALSAPEAAPLREQLSLAEANDDPLARIELLRRILDVEPGDAASHRQLIELWLKIEDYDLAEAALAAWPSAPADLTALTRAEIQRYRDRDVPVAIRTLRAYLATAPKDVAAHRALVNALLTQNDAAAQVAALDALLALSPDAVSLMQRANAKFRLAAYADALADARAAQALAPDDSTVKNNLPPFERLEETLAALPPLDASLKKNPRDVRRLIERAWWLRYGGILDRSRDDAKAALVVAPDSVAGKITLVRAQYLLDQVKAEDALRDESIDVQRAHPLDAILAVADADLALQKNPRDAAQFRARAHALNAAGQSRLVLRDADAALTLAPKDAGSALEALYASAMLNQDPAPILRRIEAMKPAKSQLALANAYLADLYLRQTQLSLALEFADRSLGFAESAYVLRIKAAALQRLGRPDEAGAATRRANALPQ